MRGNSLGAGNSSSGRLEAAVCGKTYASPNIRA